MKNFLKIALVTLVAANAQFVSASSEIKKNNPILEEINNTTARQTLTLYTDSGKSEILFFYDSSSNPVYSIEVSDVNGNFLYGQSSPNFRNPVFDLQSALDQHGTVRIDLFESNTGRLLLLNEIVSR